MTRDDECDRATRRRLANERFTRTCFAAAAVLLGLAAVVAMLGGCWGNPPIVVKERIVKVYVHEDSVKCDGLPEFPPAKNLADKNYLRHMSNWVIYAGTCLGVPVYPVAELLEVKQWRVEVAPGKTP